MINVVCLKWGAKYSAEYVNKLYSMVQRNLSLDHQFICFTDNPVGLHEDIIYKPLLCTDPSVEGWWHKLSLFQPNNGLEGTVLFLDLDIVITGSIDELFTIPGDFFIIKEWITAGFNSSVFRFQANENTDIWTEFLKHRPDGKAPNSRVKMHGDQNWITQLRPNANVWPDGWCLSFKYHHLDSIDIPPKPSKIIVFHGLPNPPDAINGWRKLKPANWILKYWW